ncbi:50S ribosomal protein L10 [Adhaeretor mobilis]|uniref:Large ribosomal subunit protein uL10 n=1 Tax=Adhaeretor mobilis TaxID=1930276 RepID=A0A517N338_9BACT|nr:50S ribosomal protein L10 [Adhaeretor mobilis]QDT01544.1 50S ribosomal protein L10 [Adhaeretor mobilis]
MSKYLKNLITDELKAKLDGVENMLVVDCLGVEANACVELRRELRAKDISMLVVKNSLARRATEGTALAPAFEGIEGSAAVVWGAEDIVSLAKEVARLAKDDDQFKPFVAKGGVMAGETMSPQDVVAVSKWPTRTEQLSLLVGQILGPGATLSGQLLGPGRTLGGQIKQKSEE